MPSVTLAQMQQRVLDRVENNVVFYPLNDVTAAINQSLRCVLLFSGFYQQTVNMPLTVQYRNIYDLPAPCLIPLNVNFEGRALQKTHLRRVASTDSRILDKRDKPKYWLPLGLRTIMILPADPLGGRYFEVQAICEVPPLVNPTDKFVLSDEWTEIIEEDAFRFLTLKEAGAVFTSAARLYMKWGPRVASLARWTEYRSQKFFIEKDSSK